MKLKTTIRLLIVILIPVLLFEECNKDLFKEANHNNSLEPLIFSVHPLSGAMNTLVTIHGSNFISSRFKTEVTFNGKIAAIDSINDSTIIAVVPARADTGIIQVNIDTSTTKGPIFNYLLSLQVATIYHSKLKNISYPCSDSSGNNNNNCASTVYDDALSLAVNKNGVLYAYFPLDSSIRKITQNDSCQYIFKSDTSNYIFKDMFQAGGQNGMAFDQNDNLYISDHSNESIKRLSSSGVLTTIAGTVPGFRNGPGNKARFGKNMNAFTIDANDNIYVADISNFNIRKIDLMRRVTTFSGCGTRGSRDGTSGEAAFDRTNAICIDSAGDIIVAEYFLGVIRKIDKQGTVTTISNLTAPYVDILCSDQKGNIYAYENDGCNIKKISSLKSVTDYAGNGPGYKDGPASLAQFHYVHDMTLSPTGEIYLTDIGNHCIRKIFWE